MKSITLLPEDFDTLDTESVQFENQYINNNDCPIARAVLRSGHKNVSVGWERIVADKKIFKSPSICYEGVKRLAKLVSARGSGTLTFTEIIVIR